MDKTLKLPSSTNSASPQRRKSKSQTLKTPMAKKKNIQPPPIATSSDDEDAETSSGEEEESNKPPVKPADSDSGSETESGSDSDMEDEASKPVAVTTTTSSKPKNKEVRASSAAAASTPPPPALKSALKRPATATSAAIKTPVKPAAAADSDSGSESESGSDSEMEDESLKPVAVTTSAKPKNNEVRGGSSTAAAAPPPALKSALKLPATATSSPPVKPAVSAAADSDSGSGSDSEMEEEPSKLVAVATSTKPKKNKEVCGSSTAASTPSPALKSALKRPATASVEDSGTAMKRAKNVEESDSKKSFFQRVWSEDDEITILQGMIDFNAQTGKSPFDNLNGYFDSVKKSFSFEPSRVQFTEKVRGLKNKYLNKGPFTKDHDKESMGLAKFIWGSGSFAWESAVVKSSNGKSKKKKKPDSLKIPVEEEAAEKDGLVCVGAHQEPRTQEKSDWFESSYVVKSIASHGLDEDYVKQKWRSAPVEDKKRLEEMYKLLRAKEVEYVLFKTEFLNEVVPMIFKSS